MRKRVVSLLLAGVMSLSLIPSVFAAGAADKEKTYPVLTEKNETYVPLRSIAEDLGFKVSWDQKTATATVSNDVYSVKIQPADKKATASYAKDAVAVPMTVKDQRIYVAGSFFEEKLDTVITVDGKSATAKTSGMAATRNSVRANEYGVKESYEYERYEVMLPMDDGVKLRTIVYKPVGEGPWPTAFTRGPYPAQEETKNTLGEEYAKRGMAYVYQYCRGKGGSEGEYIANVDERRDGITSLNWLNDQSWVKSIGMHGHSYLALTTWIVGDSLPDKVAALHVQCYGVLRNLSVSHSGLVACDNIIAWTLGNCTDKYTYDKYIESAQYLPGIKADDDLWGGNVEGYDDWINHPDFTDPYWNEGVWGDLKTAVSGIDVPTTIFGGYFDHHFEGTVEGWNLLSEETKAKSHMVLGCWNHGFGYTADWKDGSNYGYDVNTDTFNWFYSIMVNDKIPATGIDAYAVGQDKWVHLDSFPLKADSELTYYLTKDATKSDGTATALSAKKPAKEETFTYKYDPSDPKWAEGGECFLYSSAKVKDSKYSTGDLRGSHALSPAGYRDDVITFITDPMDKDTTLAGNLIANLFVSTDVEDTAFTYTISEVDADGTAHNIRNGLLTLAYRNDRYAAAVNDYKPGQIVEMKIESLPIVWTVAQGNRIRIDISSSNFPEFTNHTNTVGNWAEQTTYKVANQTIYVGGEHASSITLPVLSK